MELFLDGFEIIKDISMIKFEIINDQRIAKVMYKFRAFVKKRTVIFIRLNHKVLTVAKPCRYSKVLRYSPNQEAWFMTRNIENFCQHAAGAGFTMSARNRQNIFVAQNRLTQPLRPRDIRKLMIEHVLNTGIAAGHGIANDN